MNSSEPDGPRHGGNHATELAGGAGLFLAHQLLSTVGVLVGAGIILSVAFALLGVLGHPQSLSTFHYVLTGLPCYPIQIACGAVVGWLLAGRTARRFMLWVWVLPAMMMAYSLLAFTVDTPAVVQVGATVPFYSSATYSLAAGFRGLVRSS